MCLLVSVMALTVGLIYIHNTTTSSIAGYKPTILYLFTNFFHTGYGITKNEYRMVLTTGTVLTETEIEQLTKIYPTIYQKQKIQ